MREMVDSKDLHQMAAFVLVFVTAVTPPIEIVKPLIESLLKTLKESPVSDQHWDAWHAVLALNADAFLDSHGKSGYTLCPFSVSSTTESYLW